MKFLFFFFLVAAIPMSLSIENIWPVTADRTKSNGTESDKAGMSPFRNRAFIGTIFAAEPALAVFTLTSIRIPEFYEIVDVLAFARAIRKSRPTRYWPVAIDSTARTSALISRETCRTFLFFYCLTIGILSTRTNNYLIARLNYFFFST